MENKSPFRGKNGEHERVHNMKWALRLSSWEKLENKSEFIAKTGAELKELREMQTMIRIDRGTLEVDYDL